MIWAEFVEFSSPIFSSDSWIPAVLRLASRDRMSWAEFVEFSIMVFPVHSWILAVVLPASRGHMIRASFVEFSTLVFSSHSHILTMTEGTQWNSLQRMKSWGYKAHIVAIDAFFAHITCVRHDPIGAPFCLTERKGFIPSPQGGTARYVTQSVWTTIPCEAQLPFVKTAWCCAVVACSEHLLRESRESSQVSRLN
jgi:hypothetical protein